MPEPANQRFLECGGRSRRLLARPDTKTLAKLCGKKRERLLPQSKAAAAAAALHKRFYSASEDGTNVSASMDRPSGRRKLCGNGGAFPQSPPRVP